jgi:heat shock transcription factor, other eukaryote
MSFCTPSHKINNLKRPNKFLMKTYEMVNDSKHCEVVAWTDSGLSFEIKNESLFALQLLPKYFKHKNFSSFIRQLNMYSFRKEKDNDSFVYMHPCFVRGQKSLLQEVKRKSIEKIPQVSDNSLLQRKYESIFTRQQALQQKIDVLQNNYQDVVSYNQHLLYSILHTKEREKKIQQLLGMFVNQVKEVPPFLKPFYEQNASNEIARPIPVPRYISIHMPSS